MMVPDYIIATDAGVLLEPGKKEVPGGYAFVILNCKTMNYIIQGKPLNGKTINYSEAYAIYDAFRTLRKLTKKKISVLVVSDSKLTVMALSKWSKDTWKTNNWYHWKKKSGEIVKNQDIYRRIIDYEKDMDVRYVHINSHKDLSDQKMITKMKYKISNAGVTITNKETQLIMQMNDWADQKATEVRKQWISDHQGFNIMIKRKEGGEDDA